MTRRTQWQRPRRLGIVSWMRLLAGAPVWLLGATVAACELQPEIQRIGVCGGQHCRDEVEFALHCREVEVVYVQGRRTARVVGLESDDVSAGVHDEAGAERLALTGRVGAV